MLGVSLLLLGSCAQEVIVDRPIPDGKMKLSVELRKLTRAGGAVTRAEVPSEEGEDRVNSLFLLFFDGSANGSGEFKAYTEVELPEAVPVTNPDGNYSMNLEAVISYPAGLNVNGDYSILALANISDNSYINGSVENWMAQWAGKTENYVISHAKADIPPGNFSPSQLLMHGSQRKPAGDNQVHMLLKRDVSRLDVTNTLPDWEIATVAVWNSFPAAYIFDSGMMDYTEGTERVRRHYHITPNTADGNIRGGLYAFENQVGSPAGNDQITTCLIIGLQPSGGGAIEYFRANLHGDTGAQHLKRNYGYNLVIEGKTGTGATSEEIAYLGESNKLVYTMDDWYMDVNGLTVRDDYSTLGIPTKTVSMGRNAAIAEFKIHTFSTLPSPAPLQIRSQTYRPATNGAGDPPITARLDGNTLIIESTDLEGLETQRSGVIVLSYAGLEISMNISQAGSHDHFLIVTEPDGGILPFAAYAGIPSGLIRVQASGHWTATLHMTGFSLDPSQASDPVKMIWTNPASPGDEEYTFTDGRGYNTTLGAIIPDEADPSIDKFRVYTHSHNMEQNPREAIIVIELDGMEEQYSATIILTQNYVKNLHYVHSAGDPTNGEERVTSGGSITFDGMGNVPTTGSFAGNNDWWYVFPGYEDGTSDLLPWSATMAIAGGADDRNYFEIIREGDVDENEVPYQNATNYDVANVANNKVRIRAKGMNISGRDYRVTLRVQTDPGTFADIDVVQQSASFELVPGGLLTNKIKYQGGSSDAISVVTEGGTMKWKVASAADISFSETAIGGHSRHLVHYGEYRETSGRANDPVTLVLENGEPFEIGREYDTNVGFRVKMPKLYFPNRDINVTAAVTITVNSAGATSGGMKQTVRVAQDPLTAREYTPIHISPVLDYGNLGNDNDTHYIRDFRWAMSELFGTTPAAPILGVFATPISSQTNAYINFMYRTNNGFNTATTWNDASGYINGTYGHDGVYMIAAQYAGLTTTVAGITTSGSPMTGWSMTIGAINPMVNTGVSDTKIYQFIMDRNMSTPTVAEIGEFYDDGTQTNVTITSLMAASPSAVPILIGTGTHGNESTLVIDPKRRFIYQGEGQIFATGEASGSGQGLTVAKRNFMRNFISYMAYTMKYGSGFSDTLIDDETSSGGGVPAPWDPWWGANAVEEFNDTWPTLNK